MLRSPENSAKSGQKKVYYTNPDNLQQLHIQKMEIFTRELYTKEQRRDSLEAQNDADFNHANNDTAEDSTKQRSYFMSTSEYLTRIENDKWDEDIRLLRASASTVPNRAIFFAAFAYFGVIYL